MEETEWQGSPLIMRSYEWRQIKINLLYFTLVLPAVTWFFCTSQWDEAQSSGSAVIRDETGLQDHFYIVDPEQSDSSSPFDP